MRRKKTAPSRGGAVHVKVIVSRSVVPEWTRDGRGGDPSPPGHGPALAPGGDVANVPVWKSVDGLIALTRNPLNVRPDDAFTALSVMVTCSSGS